MLCRGAEQDSCLTATQAETLRQIQAEGFEPSSAAAPENWSRWIVNPDPAAQSQLTFAIQAFRYLLTDNPEWRVQDFNPNRDRARPDVLAALDADAVDFARFQARGGRIISYFGWGDALISPRAGIGYYRRVVARAGGIARASAFYRLFMVPGMLHCQGGGVPDSFGQSPASPALQPDPEHDVRAALERWVERGKAPEFLTAVQYEKGRRVASSRVLRPVRLSYCIIIHKRAYDVHGSCSSDHGCVRFRRR
jgi:feruloyl esterase